MADLGALTIAVAAALVDTDVVLGTAVFAGVGIRRHPQRLALDFSEC